MKRCKCEEEEPTDFDLTVGRFALALIERPARSVMVWLTRFLVWYKDVYDGYSS